MSCRLFSTAGVSLPPTFPLPPSSPLSNNRCGFLVWHRSARSNLINSCKFNYRLTAPRPRALYLLLASPRASVSSCLALLIFFHPPLFLFHYAAPRTNPSRAFLRTSSAFQLLGETLWGTRLLVNGRMWDPSSTYMSIRGLNEFQPSFRSRKCDGGKKNKARL